MESLKANKGQHFNIRLFQYQISVHVPVSMEAHTVCVVGQFYPKFKFYFPLIKTYYHTLLYKKKPEEKE